MSEGLIISHNLTTATASAVLSLTHLPSVCVSVMCVCRCVCVPTEVQSEATAWISAALADGDKAPKSPSGSQWDNGEFMRRSSISSEWTQGGDREQAEPRPPTSCR